MESYNEARRFFLKTGDEPKHNAPFVSRAAESTDIAYKRGVGLTNKEVDITQVLSLPREEYEKQKSALVYLLKRNHKKINFQGDSFRLIVSPTSRMIDLERALFGKKLTPEERVSVYVLHTNKKEGFLGAQQVANQIQGDWADRSLTYLFVSGNYMLLLLSVFLDVVTKTKGVLTGLVGLLQITGFNSGEVSQRLTSVQTLSDLLTAKKTSNNAIPDVDDINDYTVRNVLSKSISKATNDNKYDSWNIFKNVSLLDAQDILLSVRSTENSISTQKSNTDSNFKQKQGDVSAYNRDYQNAFSTEKKVWDQLARF